MKKLFASALVAAALAVPTGAAASETSAPVGTQECPQAGPGRVVYVWDYTENRYRYYKLCIYTGP
jgi:hypothetical protein